MSLKDSIENLKFDTRMRDFNKGLGRLSDSEVVTFLGGLKDSADRSELVNLGNQVNDDDDYEAVEKQETPAATVTGLSSNENKSAVYPNGGFGDSSNEGY